MLVVAQGWLIRVVIAWCTVCRKQASIWKRNAKTRRTLLELDAHQLEDIGVHRKVAEQEGQKSFWQ